MRIDSLAKFELWALEYYPIYQEAIAKYGQPTELSFWLHREYIRGNNGTYEEFDITLKRFQFAHASVDDPRQVAFTPSLEFGIADRQLRVRPGKFYQRFSGLKDTNGTKDFIAKWNRKYSGEGRFGLTNNADMIRDIYLSNACTSCMSNGVWEDREDTPVAEFWGNHPTIMLAYAKHDTRDNYYTGRAWVNTHRKQYVRVYDSDGSLQEWLQEQDYLQSGRTFVGENANPNAPWLPYLDGYANEVCHSCGYITDDGDEECGACGEYTMCVADGVYGEWNDLKRMTCESCEDGVHPDNAYYMEVYDHHICEYCYENRTVETYDGNRLYEHNTVESLEGHILDEDDPSSTGCHVFLDSRNEWAHEDNCRHSEITDEWIYEDDALEVHTTNDETWVDDTYVAESPESFYINGIYLIYAEDMDDMVTACENINVDPKDSVNLLAGVCDYLKVHGKIRDDGPAGSSETRRDYSVYHTKPTQDAGLFGYDWIIYKIGRSTLRRVLVNYDESGWTTVKAEFLKDLNRQMGTIMSYEDYEKEIAA